jgi:hypothetical protein
MPHAFFRQAAFDADTTAMLAKVFDSAWVQIIRSGGSFAADGDAAAARERLAKFIVAAAQNGQKDPEILLRNALSHMNG